jgi:hypothetical protein
MSSHQLMAHARASPTSICVELAGLDAVMPRDVDIYACSHASYCLLVSRRHVADFFVRLSQLSISQTWTTYASLEIQHLCFEGPSLRSQIRLSQISCRRGPTSAFLRTPPLCGSPCDFRGFQRLPFGHLITHAHAGIQMKFCSSWKWSMGGTYEAWLADFQQAAKQIVNAFCHMK